MKLYRITDVSKHNLLDIFVDILIAAFIGVQYDKLSAVFFCFAVLLTLNQILWAICEGNKINENKVQA